MNNSSAHILPKILNVNLNPACHGNKMDRKGIVPKKKKNRQKILMLSLFLRPTQATYSDDTYIYIKINIFVYIQYIQMYTCIYVFICINMCIYLYIYTDILYIQIYVYIQIYMYCKYTHNCICRRCTVLGPRSTFLSFKGFRNDCYTGGQVTTPTEAKCVNRRINAQLQLERPQQQQPHFLRVELQLFDSTHILHCL